MINFDHQIRKLNHVYITRWKNELERYVKYDAYKDDYVKVDIAKAQVFNSEEEAIKFADEVEDFGYDKPEIVKVLCKSIA